MPAGRVAHPEPEHPSVWVWTKGRDGYATSNDTDSYRSSSTAIGRDRVYGAKGWNLVTQQEIYAGQVS